MHVRHLAVLDDWLDFAFHAPEALVLVISDAPEVEDAVYRFATERDIPIRIVAKTPVEEIKEGETALLKQQFEGVDTDFALLVKLDTFPHRDDHQNWLPEAMKQIRCEGALFLTGSTLKFRGDTATDIPDTTYTARISNNFLLIRPETWLSIQEEMAGEAWRYGRYASEGLIESYCARHMKWGLRRLSTGDWRVIHTQAWDARADVVRAMVRAGGPKMTSYLARYEDDAVHDWERYFMFPQPSLTRRARIFVGDKRRKLSAKRATTLSLLRSVLSR